MTVDSLSSADAEASHRRRGRVLDRVAMTVARTPAVSDLPPWQLSAQADDEQIADSLAANGVVALAGWVPPADVEHMQVFASELADRLAGIDVLPYEDDQFVVDDGTDYARHLAGDRTYANVRTGRWDAGLTDVAHADLLPGFDKAWLTDFIANPRLTAIAEAAAGVAYCSQMVNLYLNDSVTETRPWHFDDNSPTAKIFIYLTDVNDPADGPYSYARGSHHLAIARLATYPANRLRGTFGDHDRFDSRRSVQVLGPAGTAVISFQNGFHRGWPQAAGRRRMLFMHSLLPV